MNEIRKPAFYVIAGPDGARKTTFATMRPPFALPQRTSSNER
jgi:hypothetical protein